MCSAPLICGEFRATVRTGLFRVFRAQPTQSYSCNPHIIRHGNTSTHMDGAFVCFRKYTVTEGTLKGVLANWSFWCWHRRHVAPFPRAATRFCCAVCGISTDSSKIMFISFITFSHSLSSSCCSRSCCSG